MKKIFFILAITASWAYGQVNIGTESISINSSVPNSYKLFIKGQGSNQLFLDNSGENNNTISFGENSLLHSYLGYNKPTNTFQLFTNGGINFHTGGNLQNKFFISSTGKFAFNTVEHSEYQYNIFTPSTNGTPLLYSNDYNGTSLYDFSNSSIDANAGLGIRFITRMSNNNSQSTSADIIKTKSGYLGIINNDPNGNIGIDLPNVGGTNPEIFVSSVGLIGIGHSTPNAKFHVKNENLQNNTFMIDSEPNINNTSMLFANNGTPMIEFKLDNSANTFKISSLKSDQSLTYWSLTGNARNQRLKITPTDIQLGSINIDEFGDVNLPGNIKFGGNSAGNIRYFSSSGLQFHDGTEWVTLYKENPETIWVATTADNNCQNVCPQGYVSSPDVNGKVCKDLIGRTFTGVSYDRFRWAVAGSTITYKDFWGCGSVSIELDLNSRLGQCHCRKIN